MKLVLVCGVSLENVADCIKAGAVAVGGNLVRKRAIAELTETARQFVAAIRGAKGA